MLKAIAVLMTLAKTKANKGKKYWHIYKKVGIKIIK